MICIIQHNKLFEKSTNPVEGNRQALTLVSINLAGRRTLTKRP
jgi:hypothetical protein